MSEIQNLKQMLMFDLVKHHIFGEIKLADNVLTVFTQNLTKDKKEKINSFLYIYHKWASKLKLSIFIEEYPKL